MTKGRSIRLFLADGTPGGIITAEIMNWTGHVMVAPRARLPDLIQRPEAGRTGLYILTGIVPEGVKPPVYIGETDQISQRLTTHSTKDKMEFWDDRVCIITSKDDNLTKAHARHLEHQLLKLAQKANRCVLQNVRTGTANGVLPEADLADMAFFIEQLQIILPVLGFDFLRDASDLPKPSAEETADAPPFEMSSPKHGVSAQARIVDGDFIVLAGSQARGDSPGTNRPYLALRDSLKADGTLVPDGPHYRFTRNMPFRSPSTASGTILDRSDNGWRTWRIQGSKKTYADWQADRLAAVTPNPVGDEA